MQTEIAETWDARKKAPDQGEVEWVFMHRTDLLRYVGPLALAWIDMLLCGPQGKPLINAERITFITTAGGRGRKRGSSGVLALLWKNGWPELTEHELRTAERILKRTNLQVTIGHVAGERKRRRFNLPVKALDVLCGEELPVRGDPRRLDVVRDGFGYRMPVAVLALVLMENRKRGGKRLGAGRKRQTIRVCPACASQAAPAEIKRPRERSSSTKTFPKQRESILSVPSEPSAARCMSMMQETTPVASSESASLSTPREVPDYPGISVVPAPYVPSPPLMDATLDEVSRVRRLLTIYDGAVRSRYKVARPATRIGKAVLVDDPLTGGKVRATRMQDAKQFIPLAAAADALVRLEVAPAAWAAFSVDVWKRFSDGTRPPPLTWVWSRDRIVERREWFQSEENGYVGRRLVLTKAHHALLRRYNAMRYALIRSDPEQHSAIIEKHFHGDKYARLVEAARRATLSEQHRLNEQAEIGAWLW